MGTEFHRVLRASLCALVLAAAAGCGTAKPQTQKQDDYFTSGSPEADRRAARVVPDESGKKVEDKDKKKEPEPAPQTRTLYDRLGGEAGITAIVDDFVKRAMEDPRVNWTRKNVTVKSWFRTRKVEPWEPTAANIERMKKHFVQFIALAAGGPADYEGKPLQPLHAGMDIRKSEFDATIGDLIATLDKLGIPADVQKELVAIFESTRPQVAPDRR